LYRVQPKQPRLRLDYECYEQIRKEVLRRDGWRSCDIRGANYLTHVVDVIGIAGTAAG